MMTARSVRSELPAKAPGASDRPEPAWLDVMEVLVEVLSGPDGSEPTGDAFYGRLCEAVCRLGGFRRSLIFRYDGASRRVRAVGAHAIDLADLADAHVTLESAPIAAEALRTDSLVEVRGDLRSHFPTQFGPLLAEPATIVCAPMGAGGRAFGVLLAERPLDARGLSEADRRLLWTLGKATALAAVTKIATTQRELAKQLEHRIDLARDVHEGVIQRLFGISMALDGEGDLAADVREKCARETQAALGELRSALQRPLGRPPRPTGTTLVHEVKRLGALHTGLGLTLRDPERVRVPAELEPLVQSVLTEAVRNAQKHARPSSVEVSVAHRNGTLVMEVVNDGVMGRQHAPGIGLRLAAFEALQAGGVVEFGESAPGHWRVRLVVPSNG